MLGRLVDRTGRHSESVTAKHQGKDTGREQLGVAVLHGDSAYLEEIGNQHAADKTDGTKYPDRRECHYRIHAFLTQSIVRHRVGNGDGGHEESKAHAIEDKQRRKGDCISGIHAIQAGAYHEQTGNAVAEREHFLGLDLTVGHYAHKGRHKDRYDALHGKEPFDLRTQTDIAQVAAK